MKSTPRKRSFRGDPERQTTGLPNKKNTTTFSVAALVLVAVLLIGMIFAARPPQQQMVAADGEIETATAAPSVSYVFPTPIPVNTVFFPTFTPIPPTSTPIPSGSTLIVTKREDTNDGVCNTDCSLREAVGAANRSQNTTITFAQGLTGVFSIRDTLPILTNVSIVSSLPKSTDIVLEMQSGVRAFHVEASGALTLKRVALGRSEQSTYGGGIHNLGTLHVEESTFNNNWSGEGGAIYSEGTVSIESCLFVANEGSLGGAIAIRSGMALIQNSTFFENVSGSGASIYVYEGDVSLRNSTLVAGKGRTNLELLGLPTGTLTLQNSILKVEFWAQPSCHWVQPGLITNAGGNLTTSAIAECIPGDVLVTDPQLAPLADNGGPTLTMALLPGSPAIGTGSNCLPRDQRGYVPSGCDAGAFQPGEPLQ